MWRDTKIIKSIIVVHYCTYTHLHTLVTSKFENNYIMCLLRILNTDIDF